MTQQETIELARRHIQSGKKIVLSFRSAMPIGYILPCWTASEHKRPRPEEIVHQPLRIVCEVSYEDYIANRPVDFPLPDVLPVPPANIHFYEMASD